MKSSLSKAVIAAALILAVTNCKGKDKDKNKEYVAPLSFSADTQYLKIPILAGGVNQKTFEVLEDSDSALLPKEDASLEDKENLARGCRYQVKKGVYSFTGLFYPWVDPVPDLNVAKDSEEKINLTFKDNQATAILSADDKETFQLDVLLKADHMLVRCARAAK